MTICILISVNRRLFGHHKKYFKYLRHYLCYSSSNTICTAHYRTFQILIRKTKRETIQISSKTKNKHKKTNCNRKPSDMGSIILHIVLSIVIVVFQLHVLIRALYVILAQHWWRVFLQQSWCELFFCLVVELRWKRLQLSTGNDEHSQTPVQIHLLRVSPFQKKKSNKRNG